MMKMDRADRGKMVVIGIRLIILISRRGYSSNELARKLSVSQRSVRRYLAALEEINIPVTITRESRNDEANQTVRIWRIEKDWARSFLKETN
jgi:predicted DNA-binding transcriptional regulator YafY